MNYTFSDEDDITKVKLYGNIQKEYNIVKIQDKIITINIRGKEYDCVDIEYDVRTKQYTQNVRKLMKNENLSILSKSAICDFNTYLDPVFNSISFQNIGELEKLLGFKQAAIYKVFKELKEKEVIVKIKNTIYINPFLYRCYDYIAESTYNLFKESKYNLLNKSKSKSNNLSNIKGEICYANDGTKCLSKAELKIHNYMLDNKINIIQKETLYKDFIEDTSLHVLCGQKRCDWIVRFNDQIYFIEYFGLISNKSYSKQHDIKQQLIELDGKKKNFISIYPKNLNRLDSIFT